MSVEKNINARVQHKHDIEANWIKAINFIPKKAELIIYDPDENFDYSRTKIGDGIRNINDLPFIIDKTEIVLKSEVEEIDAIEIVVEAGLVSPIAAEDGSIYVDENNAIYSL